MTVPLMPRTAGQAYDIDPHKALDWGKQLVSLKPQHLNWALKHVLREGDTDVFPLPFEFGIIQKSWKATILSQLSSVQIETHTWAGPRRLMVPKADFAFRPVCQLDPLDAILYAGLIREIGGKIERHRLREAEQTVFSYRFKPLANGQLYTPVTGWEQFWRTSEELCKQHTHILVTDISDFYNQIYHHTIENQLDVCGIKKPYWQAIKNLLANVTEGVSRGIPIGPHPSHLFAEMSLIPVDQYLQGLGIRFCRYVDDIHIFCSSRAQAHQVLYEFVEYLDKTQKIQTNKQKTKIFNSAAFQTICADNVVDKPINNLERELLKAVRSYTRSPYERVPIKRIAAADLSKLSQDNIESVLKEYIDAPEIDYVRLRWFIRRLTQVGVPGGVNFMIARFEDFLPALAEVARYFEAAAINYDGKWSDEGKKLLDIYNSGIVQASEYLKMTILSLFARIKGINHINNLTKMYPNSSPMCQRKIMLAAANARANGWLSGLKGAYKNADPWSKRAIIYSMRVLPKDERQFWLKAVRKRVDGLEKEVVNQVF